MNKFEEKVLTAIRSGFENYDFRNSNTFKLRILIRNGLYNDDRNRFSSREVDEICAGVKLPHEAKFSDEFLEGVATALVNYAYKYVDALDDQVNNVFPYIREMFHQFTLEFS
jgi:hypothetical protein